MSSIMRARSGLIGRGEVSEVIGLFSRAEGCWTFDARDQMPRSSRATALHLVENVPTETCAPPARAGWFIGAKPSFGAAYDVRWVTLLMLRLASDADAPPNGTSGRCSRRPTAPRRWSGCRGRPGSPP